MKPRHEEIASALPKDLDSLPRLHGFRLRGMEMTRLETFIDAAFAFAMTLLVIAGDTVPTDAGAMLGAFRNVPVFMASIVVLGIFWRGHWLWSRRYGLEDGISILLSWALLVTILIYIYPLKTLFGGMFYYVSGGELGARISIQSGAQARQLFAVFALGFIAMTVGILLLNLRAWHLREPLALNDREKSIARSEVSGWTVPLGIGVASLALALFLPTRHIQWSGWVYFSLAFLVPIHRRLRRRRAMAAGAC